MGPVGDRAGEVRPDPIADNVRGGALFLAGIPTAVTAAAFPACSLQVVCFPERLAQRQGVAHVEYFAIAHADRRQEDWDRVWPLVRRSLYHGDVVIVHCMAGRHRAALAAAMWLAMLKGISLADAAGEIRRCHDLEITKTLQDRKLAGWVHQALASSSSGASEPECAGFMATARSQVHISTAKGYPLCQHKQAARPTGLSADHLGQVRGHRMGAALLPDLPEQVPG